MSSDIYTGNQNSIAQALGAAGSAGGMGQSIYSSALQNLLGGGGASYNAFNTVGGNTLSGLSNLTQLGNNQYQLPQQVLNDIQSYLGLGQAASNISGNLGQMGLNQQQNAFSGLGSALGAGNNLLFGSNGIGGANGVLGSGGGLSGLFGGGSAIGANFATDALGAAVPLGDIAATDAAFAAPAAASSI